MRELSVPKSGSALWIGFVRHCELSRVRLGVCTSSNALELVRKSLSTSSYITFGDVDGYEQQIGLVFVVPCSALLCPPFPPLNEKIFPQNVRGLVNKGINSNWRRCLLVKYEAASRLAP